MTKTGFDCFPFAAILRMNDYFRAGSTRLLRRFVRRSVIDYQDIIKLLTRPAGDVADMFLFVVGRNDCDDF